MRSLIILVALSFSWAGLADDGQPQNPQQPQPAQDYGFQVPTQDQPQQLPAQGGQIQGGMIQGGMMQGSCGPNQQCGQYPIQIPAYNPGWNCQFQGCGGGNVPYPGPYPGQYPGTMYGGYCMVRVYPYGPAQLVLNNFQVLYVGYMPQVQQAYWYYTSIGVCRVY